MKYVKMMGLTALAAMALVASVGVGTSSATELTSPEGTRAKTGATFHAVNEGAVTLTTSFKNVECTEVTVKAKITNETGESISANVESLSYNGCNCEAKILNNGTVSISSSGKSNGAITSNGTEGTLSCSTIFGNIHCIYKTSSTAIGTLTGSTTTGATATADVEGANIPRLSTNSLCNEKAALDAKLKVDSPDTLYVD